MIPIPTNRKTRLKIPQVPWVIMSESPTTLTLTMTVTVNVTLTMTVTVNVTVTVTVAWMHEDWTASSYRAGGVLV